MKTPPKVGRAASVKVDDVLYADLATLMHTGMTLSDAIKEAVNLLAVTYRSAWSAGVYPDGVMPRISSCNAEPYTPGMAKVVPKASSGTTPGTTGADTGTTGSTRTAPQEQAAETSAPST